VAQLVRPFTLDIGVRDRRVVSGVIGGGGLAQVIGMFLLPGARSTDYGRPAGAIRAADRRRAASLGLLLRA